MRSYQSVITLGDKVLGDEVLGDEVSEDKVFGERCLHFLSPAVSLPIR